jgi:hypothetical protein
VEVEEEMWNLWKMGEDEETVKVEDTDFLCR